MNLNKTLYNIHLSKTSFFNLEKNDIIDFDLYKENIHYYLYDNGYNSKFTERPGVLRKLDFTDSSYFYADGIVRSIKKYLNISGKFFHVMIDIEEYSDINNFGRNRFYLKLIK
jgi:hypothetical protein